MSERELPETLRNRLFGGVGADVIRTIDVPRLKPSLIEAFKAIPGVAAAVADALDVLGIDGVIPASDLAPLRAGQRICGQAVTIRWARYGGDPTILRAEGHPKRIGDRDLYALAQPGDVVIVAAEGHLDSAVIGDISLGFAHHAGVSGVIVDGAVRDVDALRDSAVQVWARGATPRACKYRLACEELNGPVEFAGTTVQPGDLIVADGSGVCVVPYARAAEVAELCALACVAETAMAEAIRTAVSFEELVSRTRGSGPL